MIDREAHRAACKRWREKNPSYQTAYMKQWRSDPYNRYSEQAKRRKTNGQKRTKTSRTD